MNKTIYVRDEDTPIWDRAKELAGEKLAPVIVEGLKKFIAEREAKELEDAGFGRIELEYCDADCDGLLKRKAFWGRWIFSPMEPDTAHDDNGMKYFGAVAVTAKGAVVVYAWDEASDSRSHTKFVVFPSFEEGAMSEEHGWVVKSARRKDGVPLEELDI